MKPTSVSVGSRPRTLAARTAARNEPPSPRATSRQCSHRHEKSVALGEIHTPFSLLTVSLRTAGLKASPPAGSVDGRYWLGGRGSLGGSPAGERAGERGTPRPVDGSSTVGVGDDGTGSRGPALCQAAAHAAPL